MAITAQVVQAPALQQLTSRTAAVMGLTRPACVCRVARGDRTDRLASGRVYRGVPGSLPRRRARISAG